MTKPGLSLNKTELNIVLNNKFLFNWYIKMLIEDDEKEFEKIKFLAFFQNPEIYRDFFNRIEFNKNLKNGEANQFFIDGVHATEEIKKLGLFKEETEGLSEIE